MIGWNGRFSWLQIIFWYSSDMVSTWQNLKMLEVVTAVIMTVLSRVVEVVAVCNVVSLEFDITQAAVGTAGIVSSMVEVCGILRFVGFLSLSFAVSRTG